MGHTTRASTSSSRTVALDAPCRHNLISSSNDFIDAPMTLQPAGTGTRYVFTALHRDEADLEKNKANGFYEGTEIAVDQFVEHVITMTN
jgi:hypothetical protein